MKDEIARFKTLLGPDVVKFSAMTYQELWGRLKPLLADGHNVYERYLKARYF
jgi:hypothetical protein